MRIGTQMEGQGKYDGARCNSHPGTDEQSMHSFTILIAQGLQICTKRFGKLWIILTTMTL
jgi:hypothetical protein